VVYGDRVGELSKAKEDSASTPRELYEPSALFRKARRYVEVNHGVWYVLSAKYNVLDPDGSPIEPYDETLNNAGVEERRVEPSRRRTATGARPARGGNTRHSRWEGVLRGIPAAVHEVPVDVEIPTEGLRMGETLSWYNERIQVLRRRLARSSVVKTGDSRSRRRPPIHVLH